MDQRDSREQSPNIMMQDGEVEWTQFALTERTATRKQAEFQDAIETIQRRVSLALNEYEDVRKSEISPHELFSSGAGGAVTITIEDPTRLYEILSDVKEMQKCKKQSAVVVVEYEDRIDERTEILQQIEAFTARQSSHSQRLLDEITTDEDIDLEAVTAGIEDALDVAKQATLRLCTLSTEMIRLLSEKPDTDCQKDGPMMDKSFRSLVQKEMQHLTDNLVSQAGDLKLAQERTFDLQRKLDRKSSEAVNRMAKDAQTMMQLAATNATLQRDRDNAQSILQRTRGELADARNQKAGKPPQALPLQCAVYEQEENCNGEDLEATIAALTADLDNLQSTGDPSQIAAVRDALQKQFEKQYEGCIAQLKTQFKSKMKEMGKRFEDRINGFTGIDADSNSKEGKGQSIQNTECFQEFRDLQAPYLQQGGDYAHADVEAVDAPVGQEAVRHAVRTKKKSSPLTDETASSVPLVTPPAVREEENQSASTNYAPASRSPSVLSSPFRLSSSAPRLSTPSPILSVRSLSDPNRQMITSSRVKFEKCKRELTDSEHRWKDEVAEARNLEKLVLIGAAIADTIEAQNKHSQETETIREGLEQKAVTMEELRSKSTSLESQLISAKAKCSTVDTKYRESLGRLSAVNEAMAGLQQLVSRLGQSQPEAVVAEMQDLIRCSIRQHGTPSPTTRPSSGVPAEDCVQASSTSLALEQLAEMDSSDSVESTASTMYSIPDSASPNWNGVHSVPASAPPNRNGTCLVHGSASPNWNRLSSRSSLVGRSSSSLVPRTPSVRRIAITLPIAHGPVSLQDPSFRQSILADSASPEVAYHGVPQSSAGTRSTNGQTGPTSLPPPPPASYDRRPVVREWTTAYDSVVAFKECVARIFANRSAARSDPLASTLADICRLQFSSEPQVRGQATPQMPRHLVLMLHKMEQVLREALSPPRPDHTRQADCSGRPAGDDDAAAMLKKKEEEERESTRHSVRLAKDQLATSQLQSTVEGLQDEVALLRCSTARERGSSSSSGNGGDSDMIMFTRQNLERNEKHLQQAVERGFVSPDEMAGLKQAMGEYVTLQEQRLAKLAKGLLRQKFYQKLFLSLKGKVVRRETLEQMTGIANKKRALWALEMRSLSLTREKLAHLLTQKLNRIQADTGMLLIQPIYAGPSVTGAAAPLTAAAGKALPRRSTAAAPRQPVPNRRQTPGGKVLQGKRAREDRSESRVKKTTETPANSSVVKKWFVAQSQVPPPLAPVHPALPTVVKLDASSSHWRRARRCKGLTVGAQPKAPLLLPTGQPKCAQ